MENQTSPILLPEQNNVFLIDWITVVFHNASVSLIQSLLGLSDPNVPWETEVAFRNGYPCRTSYKHINIHWGADDERFYKSDEKSPHPKRCGPIWASVWISPVKAAVNLRT